MWADFPAVLQYLGADVHEMPTQLAVRAVGGALCSSSHLLALTAADDIRQDPIFTMCGSTQLPTTLAPGAKLEW